MGSFIVHKISSLKGRFPWLRKGEPLKERMNLLNYPYLDLFFHRPTVCPDWVKLEKNPYLDKKLVTEAHFGLVRSEI